MKALLLRLAGPMQAWGTQSRFTDRDTQLEPSKSGVIGLLCAALGLSRNPESRHSSGITLGDLADLPFAVRVDREGMKLRDHQTIGGGTVPGWYADLYGIKTYGVSKANANKPETALSLRYYLSDARFLVAIAGEENLLFALADALRRPVFPLYLGRKSFVPSEPVLYDSTSPLREGDSLEAILSAVPWDACWPRDGFRNPSDAKPPKLGRLRLVVETHPGEGSPRSDTPRSFLKRDRRFDPRYVKTSYITLPGQDIDEEQEVLT